MPEHKHSSKHKLIIFAIALLIFLCAAAFTAFRFIWPNSTISGNNPQRKDDRMKGDLKRLSEETYNSVFLTMHSAESFSEEDFASIRGLDTVVASHSILNTKELSQYLICILNSGNTVTNLHFCLDPELLWAEAGGKADKWTRCLSEGLYSYVEKYPDVTFEILLPYPSLDYWLNLNDNDLDAILTLYHTFVNELSVYPNTGIFFPGYEYWLMVNPDNYVNGYFDANSIVTQKLFQYTFCDGVFRITPENEDFFWNSLREIITREKNTPTRYPDLSDMCLIFFGDSVLANTKGSYSIPGYIEGLSGSLTYNYAIGGTSAAMRGNNEDFPLVLDNFFSEEVLVSDSGCLFTPNGIAIEDKKLCFIFNYGLNDYFSGCRIDDPQDPCCLTSYKGSLRSCISELQASFPDADYIMVSPTHISLSEKGTAVTSTEGDVLSAYVNAAKEIADEMGMYFIDNYNNFIITDETLNSYIMDGVHPNESGRLVLAARLMSFIAEMVQP